MNSIRLLFCLLAALVVTAVAAHEPVKSDEHVIFDGKGGLIIKDKPSDITTSHRFYKKNGPCPTDKLIVSYSDGLVSVNVADGSMLRAKIGREQMSYYIGEPGCQINITIRGFEDTHQ